MLTCILAFYEIELVPHTENLFVARQEYNSLIVIIQASTTQNPVFFMSASPDISHTLLVIREHPQPVLYAPT